MILNYHDDYDRSILYDILDLDTGQWLDKSLPIFHADDESGIYRVYLQDERGNYCVDLEDPDGVAWEERKGRIKIVLKPQYESEEQGLALHRAEQEQLSAERNEARRVASILNPSAQIYRPE